MKGGKKIGSGGFGDVFDSCDDIEEMDDCKNQITDLQFLKYRKITPDVFSDDNKYLQFSYCKFDNEEMLQKKEIEGDIVFKQINECKEYKNEEINNNLIWNLFESNIASMTSLHPEIKSIQWNKYEGVLVYSKFDNNLQSFLYSQKRSYEKTEWTKNEVDISDPKKFIINIITQILTFLKQLADNQYKTQFIHSDIKLDNILIKKINDDYQVVLADYGLIKKDNEFPYFSPNEHFLGLSDYMPPFCHYIERGDINPITNYVSRMNFMFKEKIRHAPIFIKSAESFFENIADTYRNNHVCSQENILKIDLHPTGIILLQLLYFFSENLDQDQIDKLYKIALNCMNNNKFLASDILILLQQI